MEEMAFSLSCFSSKRYGINKFRHMLHFVKDPFEAETLGLCSPGAAILWENARYKDIIKKKISKLMTSYTNLVDLIKTLQSCSCCGNNSPCPAY